MFVVVPIQSTERLHQKCCLPWIFCANDDVNSVSGPLLSPKLIPAEKSSCPVSPPPLFALLSPCLHIWLPSWIQNPPPLNLLKWHAAGLSLSLWDTLLWSDLSFSLCSLRPALRKIAFATKHQTFNEPVKLTFKLLVGYFFLSFYFLNDGHNHGKKNVASEIMQKSKWWNAFGCRVYLCNFCRLPKDILSYIIWDRTLYQVV